MESRSTRVLSRSHVGEDTSHSGTPIWQILYYSVLALGLLAEVALAVLVLRRARGFAAGRFLFGSLTTHVLALLPVFTIVLMGLLGSQVNLSDSYFPHRRQFVATNVDAVTTLSFSDYVTFLTPLLIAWIPAFDVAFAMSYPRRSGVAARRAWVLLLPFVAPAAILVSELAYAIRMRNEDYWVFSHNENAHIDTMVVGYVFVGACITTWIFARKRRAATTSVEAERLRFMLRAVSLPMLAISSIWFALELYSEAVFFGPSANTALARFMSGERLLVQYLAVGAYVLWPPLAMAVGVLRYRILDWDRRVRHTARFTLSYGLVTGAFAVVFFVVSEAAEQLLLSGTQSTWAGFVGAGLLALAVRPLHRAAGRFARRVVREPRNPARDARRRRIFQAAYEDLKAEGALTARAERSLDEFARTLGLSPDEVRRIKKAGRP